MQSLSSGGLTSSQRVFMTPELLGIVFEFLGRDGCARLVNLSSLAFWSGLPIVWKEADLESLLLLIPGTAIKRKHSWTDQVISLPATLDLRRVNIYAPFVKTLKAILPYEYDHPPAKSTQDASEQPLFPNLQYLSLATFLIPDTDRIFKLLPSSLLSFGMLSPRGSISYFNTSVHLRLFQMVSRGCPRLQTLRIFDQGIESVPRDLFPLLNRNLRNIQSLCDFSCSEDMLSYKSTPQVLGRLPLLRRLCFCGSPLPPYSARAVSRTPLSEDSFPVLDHLVLNFFAWSTFGPLFAMRPLFRHLTKISAVYSDYSPYMDGIEPTEIIVLALAENCPHLSALSLDVRHRARRFRASLPALEALRGLPLRSLDVRSVTYPAELGWKDFTASVPHLEELLLTDQVLELYDLETIAAALPNLRLLGVHSVRSAELVRVDSMEDNISEAHDQPMIFRVPYFYGGRPSKFLPDLSRYLYRLWPNFQYELFAWDVINGPLSSLSEEEERNLNEVVSGYRLAGGWA